MLLGHTFRVLDSSPFLLHNWIMKDFNAILFYILHILLVYSVLQVLHRLSAARRLTYNSNYIYYTLSLLSFSGHALLPYVFHRFPIIIHPTLHKTICHLSISKILGCCPPPEHVTNGTAPNEEYILPLSAYFPFLLISPN